MDYDGKQTAAAEHASGATAPEQQGFLLVALPHFSTDLSITRMVEVDCAQLQQLYGGRYIARRDGEVVASAEGYDQLIEQLDRLAVEWDQLIIEYVEPADVVCVY